MRTSFAHAPHRPARRLVAALAAGAMLLGACADDDPPAQTSGAPTTPNVDGTTPPTDGTSSPSMPELTLTRVAELDALTDMATHPESGHLYLAEREGRVQRVDLDEPDDVTEIIDISDDVTTDVERGLLGIAISPDATRLYLSYSGPDGETRLDQVTLDDDGTVRNERRRELLTLEQPFPNHNGGDLGIGPDGMLYLALGDGGAGGDPLNSGQDTSTLLGSILRIDPENPGEADLPYGIPEGNPFKDGDGGRAEIWLYGVRNPWRISWDRATDDLWIADVGQGDWEEIDMLPAPDAGRGANLGWNQMEGFVPFNDGQDSEDFTDPVYAYDHSDGRCSVTGGVVYRGEAIPALAGTYLFSDYCDGVVRGLRLDSDGGDPTVIDFDLDIGGGSLVGFGEDLVGEVYVLTLDGTLFRLDEA